MKYGFPLSGALPLLDHTTEGLVEELVDHQEVVSSGEVYTDSWLQGTEQHAPTLEDKNSLSLGTEAPVFTSEEQGDLSARTDQPLFTAAEEESWSGDIGLSVFSTEDISLEDNGFEGQSGEVSCGYVFYS